MALEEKYAKTWVEVLAELGRVSRERDHNVFENTLLTEEVAHLKAVIAELHSEGERLRKLITVCTCGTRKDAGKGPDVDCPMHGLVQQLFDLHDKYDALQLEVNRLKREVNRLNWLRFDEMFYRP